MNSPQQNYTFKDILSYTFAVLVFMFFSVFIFMDVGPDSNIWLQFLRLAANFPFGLIIFLSIYICFDQAKHGLLETEVNIIIAGANSLILFLLGSSELIFKGIGFQVISKTVTFTGIILFLMFYMKISEDPEEIY